MSAVRDLTSGGWLPFELVLFGLTVTVPTDAKLLIAESLLFEELLISAAGAGDAVLSAVERSGAV